MLQSMGLQGVRQIERLNWAEPPGFSEGTVVACRQMWIAGSWSVYLTNVRFQCINILGFANPCCYWCAPGLFQFFALINIANMNIFLHVSCCTWLWKISLRSLSVVLIHCRILAIYQDLFPSSVPLELLFLSKNDILPIFPT